MTHKDLTQILLDTDSEILKAWLEQFAEQVDLNPLLFLATALIVAIIIVACVVLKAWHIANENPVNSIKSE